MLAQQEGLTMRINRGIAIAFVAVVLFAPPAPARDDVDSTPRKAGDESSIRYPSRH
jgi:hypothetical protein